MRLLPLLLIFRLRSLLFSEIPFLPSIHRRWLLQEDEEEEEMVAPAYLAFCHFGGYGLVRSVRIDKNLPPFLLHLVFFSVFRVYYTVLCSLFD